MFLNKIKKAKQVDLSDIVMPEHIAIIMDGNGRWAKSKNMPISFGHSQGVNRIEDVVKVAIRNEIKSVSVYAFSTENWSRSKAEVDHLLKLIFKFYENKAKQLFENGVCIKFPGRKDNVPQNVLDIFEKMEEESRHLTKLELNICFNYGSRSEIVDGVNKYIKENPRVSITEEDIMKNMYKGLDREIDLLIRTSGEQRLSNFLLWQVSYSEFVFSDVLWPDFDEREFEKCLQQYGMRNRRFGGR